MLSLKLLQLSNTLKRVSESQIKDEEKIGLGETDAG